MTQTIGLLYDTHITDGGRKGYDGVPTVKTAIDKLNQKKVDWTVHGGDIRPLSPLTSPNDVDWGGWDGDDNPFYQNDFAKAKPLFEDRLNSDYYVIRGNHDRPEHVLKEYFPPEEYSPSDDLGREGAYWGVEERNGIRHVYLDSCGTQGGHVLQQHSLWVSSPQLSMLDRLAEEDPNIPTFVYIHAALDNTGSDSLYYGTEKAGIYEQILNQQSVRARLKAINTQLVNFGHVYQNTERATATRDGDITYAIAKHLVITGQQDNPGDVRWLEIDESAQTWTLYYYDLDAGTEGTMDTGSW